jgi:hypothetical protein
MNINTLCGQNVKFPNVKLDGTHSTRSTFESITQIITSTGNFLRVSDFVTLATKTCHSDPPTHSTGPGGRGNHHFTEHVRHEFEMFSYMLPLFGSKAPVLSTPPPPSPTIIVRVEKLNTIRNACVHRRLYDIPGASNLLFSTR